MRTRLGKLLGFGASLALALVFFVASGLAQVKEPGKQIVVETLKQIDNPQSDLKLELWVDREDATYKVDDQIVFSFKSNKDCRLTLFNVGTSGKVYILFPNEHHQENLVKAGEVYRVPPEGAKFAFKAVAPAGEDVVKAIATLENIPLISQDATKPAGPFQEVVKPERDIAITIENSLKPVDPKRWGEIEKLVKIVQ